MRPGRRGRLRHNGKTRDDLVSDDSTGKRVKDASAAEEGSGNSGVTSLDEGLAMPEGRVCLREGREEEEGRGDRVQ